MLSSKIHIIDVVIYIILENKLINGDFKAKLYLLLSFYTLHHSTLYICIVVGRYVYNFSK